MFLHKKDAAAVADVLLPVRSDTSVFEPTGFERLSFVMLSANIITSSAFALWGVKQLDEVLGQNFQQIALDTFHEAELFAARYLPTGLAFLVTLGFAVTGFTFLYALLHTAGFKVCRNGGVIISKGGFVTLIERRILVACVSACDVCVTPPARLLRRYPVYLSAGSFRGGDLPVLVYKKGEERTVERLLPNFCPPDGPLCMPARKSPVQYLWQPGTLLALSLGLCGVASYTMPQILPMLFVPAVLALAGLLVSLEGFFREGLRKNANRTLSVCYTRFFTPARGLCVHAGSFLYAAGKPIFRQRRAVRRAGAPALRAAVPCARRTAISGAGNTVHAVNGVTVLFRRCAGTAPRFILILERS